MNHSRSARLRQAGIMVLAVGLVIAGLVYGIGIRSESDDASLLEDGEKRQTRELERLWGTGGTVMVDLDNQLRRPGVQAGIIAAITGLLTLGCFYVASKMDWEERMSRRATTRADAPPPPPLN